jgi:hypothetical protein
MGIRVEHTVHKLPDSYVTKETVFRYIPSEDDPKIKVRVEEVVEHRGGYLVKFMRGHSIRLFDEKHLEMFGLTTAPRLIDETTGAECNEHGVPLDIAQYVKQSNSMQDGDAGDELGSLLDPAAHADTGDPITDIIKDTE